MLAKFRYLSVLTAILFAPNATAQSEQSTDLPESALTDLAVEIRKAGLPVVIIDTENKEAPTCTPIAPPEGCMGNGITQNEYVKGRIYIIENDKTVYDSGDYVKGESGMRTKVRGNTSAYMEHKSQKVKLEKKADLLGRNDNMYADKEWVLNNSDCTCNLKTVLGFYLGEKIRNQWQPAYRFVNFIQNDIYKGIYFLCEPVARDVDYSEIDKSGYLIECDPYWWNEEGTIFHTDHLPYSMAYTFKFPDSDDLTNTQLEQIRGFIGDFEKCLYDGDDYSDYIDVNSFVNWMLVHDLLGTWDSAGSNIFVKKQDYRPSSPTSTKLQMGPVWDLNTAFKMEGGWARIHYDNCFYFSELFKDNSFILAYAERWNDVRDKLLDETMTKIEDFYTNNGKAVNASRELMKKYAIFSMQTIEEDIKETEYWLSRRIPWMDNAVNELVEQTAINVPIGQTLPSSIKIYTVDGKLYKSMTDEAQLNAWNNGRHAPSLSPGVWFVQEHFSNGTTQVKKLVVK